MNSNLSRRGALKSVVMAIAGACVLAPARKVKSAVRDLLVTTPAPTGYDPFKAQMADGAGRGPVHWLRDVCGGL